MLGQSVVHSGLNTTLHFFVHESHANRSVLVFIADVVMVDA